MNRWIKRIGWLFVILGICIGVLVATGLYVGEQRKLRKMDVPVEAVALREDAATVERGGYLYGSRGCVDCHGKNGGGATLADDGKGLKLAGPNITKGNPRIAAYQPIDWVRSIRHGVGSDRRVLRLMPSEDYNRLTDQDLASIVAYVRQLAASQAMSREPSNCRFPAA